MAKSGDPLSETLLGLNCRLGGIGHFLNLNRLLRLVQSLGVDALGMFKEVVDVPKSTIELLFVLFGFNPSLS